MRIVCDIEASGLIDYRSATPYPDHVWCVVAIDIDTNKIHKFVPDEFARVPLAWRPLSTFKKWSRRVTEWWFHSGLSYDVPVLNYMLGCNIPYTSVKDTLVYSKMSDQRREGGHSLDNLSKQAGGTVKGSWSDWTQFSRGMLSYCVDDVRALADVRLMLLEETKDFSEQSIDLEHQVRVLLDQQQINGFYLNQALATHIYEQCKAETDAIEAELDEIFTPRPMFDREFTPRATKSGTIAVNSTGGYPVSVCSAGATFSRLIWKPFKMSSTMEKLFRLEGWWRPFVKTKSGQSWKICEENLETLTSSAPEGLHKMKRWSILNSRHSTIWSDPVKGKGNASWLGNIGEDGRIHGYVDGLGAYTNRCAHQKPNMANVPAAMTRTGEVALFGKEMRQCWTVSDPSKYCIVGTDASGIQLRVLAHYINNDEYTYEVVNGDVHEKNRQALGLRSPDDRPIAKTFIYAWLLGAQLPKVASILSSTRAEARRAVTSFIKNIKGLSALLSRKTEAARRGYMIGLDGRLLKIPSDHHALSVYLQGGEAVIMKLAMTLWNKWATAEELDYKQCSFVHDEWQSECAKVVHEDIYDYIAEDMKEAKKIYPDFKQDRVWSAVIELEPGKYRRYLNRLGELQVRAIREAGKLLKLNVELDGEYQIGQSWAETH